MTDPIEPFPPPPFEIISLIIEQILEIEPKRARKDLHSLEALTHLSLVSRNPGTYAIRFLAALLRTLCLADSITVCIILSPWLKDETGNYLESPEPRVVLATSAEQDLHDERLDHVLRRRITDLTHFMRQRGRRLESQEMDIWQEAEQVVRSQRVNPDFVSHSYVCITGTPRHSFISATAVLSISVFHLAISSGWFSAAKSKVQPDNAKTAREKRWNSQIRYITDVITANFDNGSPSSRIHGPPYMTQSWTYRFP
ncbi:hypothetical protein C8J56DRAFT_1054577 [Mycena floridula]|nr:hypothetical protein C8J56DRAFT_1054577 [Mycena floridula]